MARACLCAHILDTDANTAEWERADSSAPMGGCKAMETFTNARRNNVLNDKQKRSRSINTRALRWDASVIQRGRSFFISISISISLSITLTVKPSIFGHSPPAAPAKSLQNNSSCPVLCFNYFKVKGKALYFLSLFNHIKCRAKTTASFFDMR